MSTKPLNILGEEIRRGTSKMLELHIAKLHTHNPISAPVIIERAKKDGPVLLLMAGVHGDEINGVAILRETIRRKYNVPTAGTVICIPVLNVFGYLIQSREFPDGRDLNRMFPGSSKGSLASQFAHAFSNEIAPHVDYVLDFHTGGAGRENSPQTRCVIAEEDNLAIAKAFGAPYIVNSRYIPKSVRATFNKLGKTAIIFEGGRSKHIDPVIQESGVNGIFNVMKMLGMQTGRAKKHPEPIIVKSSKWIRAPYSGLFQAKVGNGSYVLKNKVLGTISDPYGEFEKPVKAPNTGHIFCLNTAPVVNKGTALFHISTEIL